MSFQYDSNEKNGAVDSVIQYMLHYIKSNNLPAGTKLPSEVYICDQLHLSRGPVREAMKMLHSTGIIEIKHGSGTFVASDQAKPLVNPLLLSLFKSPWGIDQLIGLREKMDILVYYTIITNNDDDTILQCEIINEKINDGIKNNLPITILCKFDVEFHRCMAKCIDNELLKKIYFFAYDFYEMYVHNQYKIFDNIPFLSHDYHVQILTALKKRDLYGAAKALHENLEYSKKLFNIMDNIASPNKQ
jgi:GntR family transcriptional repressor for pyruvate dehydrogenase complex